MILRRSQWKESSELVLVGDEDLMLEEVLS